VQRLIAGAKNLYHRTLLLTLYGTGLRRSEVCHLKVRDIDGQRMVLRVQQGKGHRDRDVPLSPTIAGCPGASNAPFKASCTSPMSRMRSFGSFCRQRCKTVRTVAASRPAADPTRDPCE
jgi:hypothetical protein